MQSNRPLQIIFFILAVAILISVTVVNVVASDKETVLHAFSGSDGANPETSLILDSAGNLYGTTHNGGNLQTCTNAGCGVVFRLEPTSGGGYKERVLYSFTSETDAHGSHPVGLFFDAAGTLYGVAQEGGTHGCGVFFKLAPTARGPWKETVLHTFSASGSGRGEGCYPNGGLVFDTAGNLYGTTVAGGRQTEGVVFQLIPVSGGKWQYRRIHDFVKVDGMRPNGGLVFDAAGNLYGTTAYGGNYRGVVFELSPGSNGQWTDTTIYTFGQSGKLDGIRPLGGLVIDSIGNLYGTTGGGGTHKGYGTVFQLVPGPQGQWTESIIYRFTGGRDGQYPIAGLTFDAVGNLYGTTSEAAIGCSRTCGTVFELSPGSNGQWTETVLHALAGGKQGGNPYASVVLDSQGNLYGTAAYEGNNGCGGYTCGVVFKVSSGATQHR